MILVSTPDIAKQITDAMAQYTAEVKSEIESSIKNVGTEAKARLKSSSPFRKGKYRRGWTVKTETRNGVLSLTVYNKNGWLTNILEKGHKKRGGNGFVAGRPHIADVEEWAVKAAEEAVRKAVQG
ncbi:MAG: HK97 gp10 family phage protein [Oscillospiraceae bacterium]|nr:HK97 gp10 family phage protein [Oscillospiraceae bacterium]